MEIEMKEGIIVTAVLGLAALLRFNLICQI